MRFIFDSRAASSASATEWSFLRPALTTSNNERFEIKLEWVSIPHSWYLINNTNDSHWLSNNYNALLGEVLDYYLAHYLQFIPPGVTWDTTRDIEEQVREFEELARDVTPATETPTLHEHFSTTLGETSARKVVLNHGSYDAYGLARELQRAHRSLDSLSAEEARQLFQYTYHPYNSKFSFKTTQSTDSYGFVFTDRSPLDCMGLEQGVQSGLWTSSKFAHFLPVTSVDVMLCNYSIGGELSNNTLHTVQVDVAFGSLITASGGEWLPLSERVMQEFSFCFNTTATATAMNRLDFNGVPWTLCLSVRKISTNKIENDVRQSNRSLAERSGQKDQSGDHMDQEATQPRG